MSKLPVIGITMGDPSGIGPEIILKTLSDSKIYEFCKPLIFGDPGTLSMEFKGLAKAHFDEISEPNEVKGIPGRIELMAISRLERENMMPGKPSVEGGKAMVNYIIKAVELAKRKELAAMVTCPISKILMNQAGHHFEGHTPLIAHLTETDDHVMMLAGDRLRVTLVTIHCALKDVPAGIDENKIYKTIRVTERALKKDFGIKNPRIAVAALNPHAGESGLFGSEEKEIILPAIKRAIAEGSNVTGPLPADTLYVKAVSGQFDAVVNMYHDQGLIPLKLLHFSDAVNVTLGLPIVRTSVDHGTAYDIAGKGKANPGSLKAAIRMAATIAKNREYFEGVLRN
ncbi:4-hydroxythreonine-4-phosphate dehydrogenase PdxA [Thermodesulfobacteriota bacterium]